MHCTPPPTLSPTMPLQTPTHLDRIQRISHAIDALRRIGCADIEALDDALLEDLHSAIRGRAGFAEAQIALRRCARQRADELRDATDTQWPDAIEDAA